MAALGARPGRSRPASGKAIARAAAPAAAAAEHIQQLCMQSLHCTFCCTGGPCKQRRHGERGGELQRLPPRGRCRVTCRQQAAPAHHFQHVGPGSLYIGATREQVPNARHSLVCAAHTVVHCRTEERRGGRRGAAACTEPRSGTFGEHIMLRQRGCRPVGPQQVRCLSPELQRRGSGRTGRASWKACKTHQVELTIAGAGERRGAE